MSDFEHNRREVIAGMLATGGRMLVPDPLLNATEVAAGAEVKMVKHANVTLRINGHEHACSSIDVNTTLLDCLRDQIHLTGTKKGCGLGQCGVCTVLVDGRRVNACLLLTVMLEGKEIIMIEGLADGDQMHPLQKAFIEQDAFQCGYCTSGQIVSGVACVSEGHAKTDDEIREWMSGNLCRCGAYPNIVAAVRQVARGAAQ